MQYTFSEMEFQRLVIVLTFTIYECSERPATVKQETVERKTGIQVTIRNSYRVLTKVKSTCLSIHTETVLFAGFEIRRF